MTWDWGTLVSKDICIRGLITGGDDRIVERIDRVLAIATWRDRFQRDLCLHGIAIGSDHVPITLSLDHSDARS